MQLPSHLVASRRSRILIPLSIFVIFGIAFSYYHTFNFVPGLPQLKSLPLWPASRSKFWPSFASILANNHPKCAPPPRPSRNAAAKSRFYDDHWKIRPDRSLVIEEGPFENLLTMKDEDVLSMHKSHSSFVDLLEPTPLALEYKSGTKGIVTSARRFLFSRPDHKSSDAPSDRLDASS